MKKKLRIAFIFITLLLSITVAPILLISFKEINTNIFNSIIQKQFKKFIPNLELKVKSVKIFLDLKKLNLHIKAIEPQISDGATVGVNSIARFYQANTRLSILAFFQKKFPLNNVDIELKRTEIRRVLVLVGKFRKFSALQELERIIKRGDIKGKLQFVFTSDGKIKDDFIQGEIHNLDGKWGDWDLKNVDSHFKIQKNIYNLNITRADFFGIDLKNSKIQIEKKQKNLNIQARINGKAKMLDINNILSKVKGFKNPEFIKLRNLSFDITNEVHFTFSTIAEESKKFKNFSIGGKGEISYLHLKSNLSGDNKEKLHEINKNIQENIIFKNNAISFLAAEKTVSVQTKGLVNFANKYVKYSAKVKLNPKSKKTSLATQFESQFNLDPLELNIKQLNYTKKRNSPASIRFSGNINKDKELQIRSLNYSESKNRIILKNLKFNSEYQIEDFTEIFFKTSNIGSINNDIKFSKNKEIISIQGEVVDVSFFLKDILKKKDKKDKKKNLLSDKFGGSFSVNLAKITNGANTVISDIEVLGKLEKNTIPQLNSKAHFSDGELLAVAVESDGTNGEKKKLLVDISNVALFINGLGVVEDILKKFQEGKLEIRVQQVGEDFEGSLQMTDFLLKEIPVAVKLLNLASLVGEADTLAEVGIKFNELKIDFRTENNRIYLKNMHLINPSNSFLLEGFIDRDKDTLDLKGVIVPFAALNKIIALIPIYGDILVGSKIGEGIFGISFQIKGDLKKPDVTINPTKTILPRFIVRAIDYLEKKFKKEPSN